MKIFVLQATRNYNKSIDIDLDFSSLKGAIKYYYHNETTEAI